MLPFPDASFDIVVSLIGAMFAPRPDLVAAELTRVCRPGGTIAMATWTPGGFIGRPLRLDVTRHLRTGTNTLRIEPFAPRAARLAVYSLD